MAIANLIGKVPLKASSKSQEDFSTNENITINKNSVSSPGSPGDKGLGPPGTEGIEQWNLREIRTPATQEEAWP